MQDTLRALRTLQEIDQEMFRVREELRRLPAERDQRRAQIDRVAGQRDEYKRKGQELRIKIHEIDDMTTQQRQRVRKLEKEIANVGTDMALLAAFQHEIRSLKREISQAEEEGLGFVEQADEVDAEAARLQSQIDEAEATFVEFSANVEREMAEANARREELEAERVQRHAPGGMETNALELYERLLEVREGIALAELDGRICQMCYIEVPPNLYVRVLRGTEVVQCPSCDRILFQREN